MITRRVAIGSQVKKGELIGVVSDPYGDTERSIMAPVSGIVLGRLELPLVYQGDAIFHIAVLEGDPEAGQLVEELTSDLGQEDFWPRLT